MSLIDQCDIVIHQYIDPESCSVSDEIYKNLNKLSSNEVAEPIAK